MMIQHALSIKFDTNKNIFKENNIQIIRLEQLKKLQPHAYIKKIYIFNIDIEYQI